jgi:mono/diheme cytochrome c family protein
MTSPRSLIPWFATCSLLLACSKEAAPTQEAQVSAPATTTAPAAAAPASTVVSASEAKKVFVARCAACHGTEGKGDGPGSAALDPKPRNYTDKDWQKAVTDEQIAKTIQYGGAAVGKSPIMPASPDLSPEAVQSLVKVVREFGK